MNPHSAMSLFLFRPICPLSNILHTYHHLYEYRHHSHGLYLQAIRLHIYLRLLRFYSELNRNVDIFKDLEIKNEDNEVMITTDRNVIDRETEKKYKGMLRDEGFKKIY